MTESDITEQRQFEDVIAQGSYMMDVYLPDSKGTIHVRIPKGAHYDVPLRAIVASEHRNLMMAGRCISADFMAISALRVQVICMATGHAAGVTAALAAQADEDAREIDFEKVQEVLLSQGAILD